MTSPDQPPVGPKPAHIASHEVYLAGLDAQYLGADFSQGLNGSLRLNAATIIARDITRVGHTELEAAQVVRNICTYTARRIELGRATTTGLPFVTQAHEPMASTHALLAEERSELGLDDGQTWVDIRKFVAERLIRDIADYHESLVDDSRTAQERDNISSWLPTLRQVAEEMEQEVVVTSGPRLLPGVEVIALDAPTER